MIIGDSQALTGFDYQHIAHLSEALRLHSVSFKKAGDDFMISGYVKTQ
jgi:hypothetical protein